MDNPPSVVQAKAPSPFTFLLTPTLSDRPTGSPLRTDPESDHFLSRPSPHHLHPPLGSQGDLPHWPCFLCLGLSSLETQQSGVELPCQSTLPHTQAHVVCTLSLQWPDPVSLSPLCLSLAGSPYPSTGGHILHSSASCLTPHRDLLTPVRACGSLPPALPSLFLFLPS